MSADLIPYMRLLEELENPLNRMLVLVHPGSTLGSADFNIGKNLAKSYRDMIINDLKKWNDHFVVIDGSLSDELAHFPMYQRALDGALERAKAAGKIAHREWGCDDQGPGASGAMEEVIRKFDMKPDEWKINFTGAWTSRGAGHGCVDGAYDAAQSLGFKNLDILDSAIDEEPYEDDEFV